MKHYKIHLTDTSVHDSQATDELLEASKNGGQDFYADSAYTGEEQEKVISKKDKQPSMRKRVSEPSLDSGSKIFQYCKIKNPLTGGAYLRIYGKQHERNVSVQHRIKRIKAIVSLMNLTYNMFRKIQLVGSVCSHQRCHKYNTLIMIKR